MEQSVKIPVVERKNTPRILLFKWLAIINIFLLILAVVIDNKLLALASGSILIICIFAIRTNKRYSTTGFVIFSKDEINIHLQGIKKTILVKEINFVKIKYGGYSGEPYPNPKSIFPKDGTGNFVYISQESGKYSFELLFDKLSLNLLNRITEMWKQRGVNVTIIGGWGIEVGSL
ncbi:MAG: hypothetical protein R6V72_01850 [Cyclobacterium sp.]|uniref:hypothetical protein n=1 Tax=Cyclobacterium sp. TaxID=1966343 RepID=UPI00397088AA